MDIFNFIILPYECSCQFDLSMLYMSNISIKLNNRNIYFSLSLSLYQKSINCTIVTIVDLSWRRVNHGCHRQVLVLFSKFLLFRSFFLCLFCSCCFSYNTHPHLVFLRLDPIWIQPCLVQVLALLFRWAVFHLESLSISYDLV